MRILAYDLGDFNTRSAWSFLDTDTTEVASGTVLTTGEDLSQHLVSLVPDRVLCEACTSTYLLAHPVPYVGHR